MPIVQGRTFKHTLPLQLACLSPTMQACWRDCNWALGNLLQFGGMDRTQACDFDGLQEEA